MGATLVPKPMRHTGRSGLTYQRDRRMDWQLFGDDGLPLARAFLVEHELDQVHACRRAMT